jgi:ABC-type phosphate/phosphonate transport system substrate-binding protein
MSNDSTILLGAVAYDPKVVTIWEGIRDHFRAQGAPMDFALFSNYERQVERLLGGHIDVAWNTPLAHVRVQRRTEGRALALGMRDSDRDFHSKIVVRKAAGIRTLADLAGKTLAVGSRDSTQARILPLHFLKREGIDLKRVKVLAFDTDIGKHGDTGRSELDVLKALHEGEADAGTIGDLVWITEHAAGLPTLSPDKREGFTRALFAMRWDDPDHRRLLQLEGLKEWMPPRDEGYDSLRAALDDQGDW